MREDDENGDAQESRMIYLAQKMAEKQLEEGKASTPVLMHYLNMSSRREALEQEMLQKRQELADAKVGSIRSAQNVEELYEMALNSMKRYSGENGDNEEF